MTHAMDYYGPLMQYGRLLAICGVRYDASDRDDSTPTCPWCAKKLAGKQR